MNYAKEAALAAVDALTSSEKAGSAVNVYNAWYSISNVLRNLRTAGKDDIADEVRTALYAVAPEAMLLTMLISMLFVLLISVFVLSPITVGLYRIYLDLIDGKEVRFESLFALHKQYTVAM